MVFGYVDRVLFLGCFFVYVIVLVGVVWNWGLGRGVVCVGFGWVCGL